MTDMPTTSAELEAWVKTVTITSQEGKNMLGFMRTHVKQLENIPDVEQFASQRAGTLRRMEHDWKILEAAATPKDKR